MRIFSCNSLYPLPNDSGISAHTNGEHNHVSRYKSYYQKKTATKKMVEKTRKFFSALRLAKSSPV